MKKLLFIALTLSLNAQPPMTRYVMTNSLLHRNPYAFKEKVSSPHWQYVNNTLKRDENWKNIILINLTIFKLMADRFHRQRMGFSNAFIKELNKRK